MTTPTIVSVFNNKGGVGKTTLTFHLGHALAELGKKTLLVDLDPQCNLTIFGLDVDYIEKIWNAEDPFIDNGFDETQKKMSSEAFSSANKQPRTIHYLLKPTEEGTGELTALPPPIALTDKLHLIPGRLTLHMYEDKIAARWSDLYRGDPLAIRTIARIRALILDYARAYGYDIALVDTSPSLGSLNKVAISTVDGFVIPCLPDVFSLYGIRNIGSSLSDWTGQFEVVSSLLSDEKRRLFPGGLVKFLGFTIYNAKRYSGSTPWDLARAHYNHAQKIPGVIKQKMPLAVRAWVPDSLLEEPIGKMAVMHTHNTLPSMAQKYRRPIWRIPSVDNLDPKDRSTVMGNRQAYESTRDSYILFAADLLKRIELARSAS
ncbi:ParA family protein [Sorangium sp. So ce1182]|uniref:ParA family protein n=1 Tax=Sorangium sp. So ce1182 TaxID=3133334 RepID=UPI003F5DBE58